MMCIYIYTLFILYTYLFLLFDIVFLCTRLVKRPVFFAVFFSQPNKFEETKISGESDVRGDIRRESLESRWRNSRVLIGVDGRSPAPV